MTDPVRSERCLTGVPGLDAVLGGGLVRGRSVLVKGRCGVGKSILGAQFICSGFDRYHEPGIFVLLEQNLDNFKRDLSAFGLDLEGLQDAGGLVVIDASLSRYSLREESARGMRRFPAMLEDKFGIEEIVDYILEAAAEIKAQRIVLDNLPAIDNLLKQPEHVRDNIIFLSCKLQSKDLTSILISDTLDCREDDIESYVSDGVIVLENLTEGLRTERQLHVRKMRGTTHSERIHPVEFRHGVGVAILDTG